MRGYSFSEASRIVGVSRSRLRAWTRAALVRPSLALRSGPAFDFRDLVGMRRVEALRRGGVSLRSIRRCVDSMRTHLPEIDRPLEALRSAIGGRHRVVVRYDQIVCEPEGQLVLDFEGEPPSHEAVTTLADAATARGPDPERALQWFEEGCRLDANPRTQDDAMQAYRRALEADPNLADAHCNLGTLHYHRGERDAARSCYERALRSEPEHVEANLNLAGVLEEEGRTAGALTRYLTALRADPLRAEAHLATALLCEKLEARRRAQRHWRCYLQLAPDGAWADVARRHLESDEAPPPPP